MICFDNRDGYCLLRGPNWIFKQNSEFQFFLSWCFEVKMQERYRVTKKILFIYALNTKKLSQSELHFWSPCFSSFRMEWGLVLLYLFVTFNYFNHHSSPCSSYFHLVAPANLVNTWVWGHKSLHHAGSGTRSPAGGRGPSGSPESRL
jgi:hypothetical protein